VALGAAFDDLDPQLRTYFGPIPAGFVGIGTGRYSEAGLRVRWLRPLFALAGLRGIAFAERAADVPFTVWNVPTPRGTLNATRTFQFATVTRNMTDAMGIVGGRLVDRIGSRGEIEVEFVAHVRNGCLHLESRRLALRLLGIRVPMPRIARVALREQPARSNDGTQHVQVEVIAPPLGQIYGYTGSFTYTLKPSILPDTTHERTERATAKPTPGVPCTDR
jgi:hypothetical protein